MIKLFSKSFRGQGRVALVVPRKARNKNSAFLLDRVFFAPPICKEKPAMECMLTNSLFVCENLAATFFFWHCRRKRKKLSKKKSAAMGGSAPPPCKLFEKSLSKNFLSRVREDFKQRYSPSSSYALMPCMPGVSLKPSISPRCIAPKMR